MAPSLVSVEQVASSPCPDPATESKKAAVSFTTKEIEEEVRHVLNPDYKLLEQPIGTRRPIRVVCLGAGYSGLMMGILFNERLKYQNIEFVIYERNEDLGGTWYENR